MRYEKYVLGMYALHTIITGLNSQSKTQHLIFQKEVYFISFTYFSAFQNFLSMLHRKYNKEC
jgi:hypothetical protein